MLLRHSWYEVLISCPLSINGLLDIDGIIMVTVKQEFLLMLLRLLQMWQQAGGLGWNTDSRRVFIGCRTCWQKICLNQIEERPARLEIVTI